MGEKSATAIKKKSRHKTILGCILYTNVCNKRMPVMVLYLFHIKKGFSYLLYIGYTYNIIQWMDGIFTFPQQILKKINK